MRIRNSKIFYFIVIGFLPIIVFYYFYYGKFTTHQSKDTAIDVDSLISSLKDGPEKSEIKYGREIFFNTASVIGPNSEKKFSGNLLSCKNCHLQGGALPYGLSLLDSHGQYPQYRSREGKILTLADRINSCIVNPLRGKALPLESREMQSLLLYIRLLGTNRPILLEEIDHRLPPINFPNLAASPARGEKLYRIYCQQCHGMNGEGKMEAHGNGFSIPPLWGPESYTFGSSMSRVGILARFVKANMPLGEASFNKPKLTDSEALDVAAFVNSETINPRPEPAPGRVLFPNPELKPFDYSRGPFADGFPPDQHKYGPFKPIIEFYKEKRVWQKPTDGDLNAP